MRPIHLALAAGAAGALVMPGVAAAAATKTVYMGPPPSTTTKKLGALNDDPAAFFRRTVTIHVGDRVRFVPESFHTVDIPPRGRRALPLIVPGGTASGYTDAAGNPFWWDGHVPKLAFNPALFGATPKPSYDGTKRVDSGLPLGPPTPFTVTFARKGRFTYFCDVHAGMKGTVVVSRRKTKIPSRAEDRAALRAQLKGTLAATRKAIAKPSPKNTFTLGRVSPQGTDVLAMFPKTLRVKRGAVVTFLDAEGLAGGAHRGLRDRPDEAGAYLKPLADSFGPAPFIDPRASYASDRALVGLTPATHGNAFWNSGVLDRDKTTPVGFKRRLRFDRKGRFTFWCLVHPNMRGTVIVK